MSAGGPPPDWVALLPAAGAGRVRVVGRADRGSPAATLADAARRADTVVIRRDRHRDVRRGLALLAPGGTLRVEHSTRLRRRRLVRRLRRAGLEVSVWWHRPSRERARCLVRLDDRVAAATVLRTVADRGRWARAEAWLAASGLARLGAAEVSVLGVDRAGGAAPALAAPDPGRPIDGLVTPRFSTSRALVGVSTRDGGRRLDRVVKVARHPADDPEVADEAHQLEGLLARAGRFPGAPAHASAEVRGPRTVLVEDAVAGRPLDRRAVRRDPRRALVTGRRWVEGLPYGPRSRPADDGRATDLVWAPLAAVTRRPGLAPGRRADLAARAAVLLEPLLAEPLPVVFEHGDLCHPNLLVAEDGSLAVVDWERARTDGLPFHDLTLFIAYVVESVERPSGPDELAEVVGRAMRPHGWAWPEIDLHAEHLELDRRLVPLLQLASWTRRVAALAPDAPARHRHEVLWAAAVEDLEERR